MMMRKFCLGTACVVILLLLELAMACPTGTYGQDCSCRSDTAQFLANWPAANATATCQGGTWTLNASGPINLDNTILQVVWDMATDHIIYNNDFALQGGLFVFHLNALNASRSALLTLQSISTLNGMATLIVDDWDHHPPTDPLTLQASASVNVTFLLTTLNSGYINYSVTINPMDQSCWTTVAPGWNLVQAGFNPMAQKLAGQLINNCTTAVPTPVAAPPYAAVPSTPWAGIGVPVVKHVFYGSLVCSASATIPTWRNVLAITNMCAQGTDMASYNATCSAGTLTLVRRTSTCAAAGTWPAVTYTLGLCYADTATGTSALYEVPGCGGGSLAVNTQPFPPLVYAYTYNASQTCDAAASPPMLRLLGFANESCFGGNQQYACAGSSAVQWLTYSDSACSKGALVMNAYTLGACVHQMTDAPGTSLQLGTDTGMCGRATMATGAGAGHARSSMWARLLGLLAIVLFNII